MREYTKEEALARMWIVCDPSRQPLDPDAIGDMYGDYSAKPNWHWFVERAKKSIKFLEDNGFTVVEKGK